MTRGIKNKNPGNIKDFGIPWDGLVTSITEKTFCVFQSPWYGIRAMAKIFVSYSVRHGLYTISDIIGRWAPGSDNNPTQDYVDFVAKRIGIAFYANIQVTDFKVMEALVEAVIHFENGKNPYTWEIRTGIIMAGIDPQIPNYGST